MNQLSRHRFSVGYVSELDDQTLFLGARAVFLYRPAPDNRRWPVVSGDTLFNIASRSFRGLPRSAGLWWVIADFQPTPIHDPTIALVPGTVLVVPSLRMVQMELFNDRRRSFEVA